MWERDGSAVTAEPSNVFDFDAACVGPHPRNDKSYTAFAKYLSADAARWRS